MYLSIATALDRSLAEESLRCISKELQRVGIILPASFHETLFESATPRSDAVPVIDHIEFTEISENARVAIWITAAVAVHDFWCSHTMRDFANSPHRYQWMPFELLGLPAAREFARYVTAIMSLLYLVPNEGSIVLNYGFAQRKFLLGAKITTASDLVNFIEKHGVRSTIDGKYEKIIGFDHTVATGIAQQILTANPSLLQK